MTTYITKIYLPEKARLLEYVDKIYESGWLTNNGPLVQELEERLAKFLNVKNVLVTGSGTLALQVAIKTLGLTGNVITTPFTYVATTGAIVAEGVQPRYVDIEPDTFNLDPKGIEAAIDDETSAIVPVHVFGSVCNIDAIKDIADRHNLPVMYDAAHTFAIDYRGQSVFSQGDISAISFHATKIYHTIEGGAVVINDDSLYEKAKAIRNYGIDGANNITYAGINGKMNEFEAAMGICNLDAVEDIMAERKKSYDYYRSQLANVVTFQHFSPEQTMNYSYLGVLFPDHDSMIEARDLLHAQQIFPKQYFFPSLDTTELAGKQAPMHVSRDIVERILVLPMHSGAEVPISETILQVLSK